MPSKNDMVMHDAQRDVGQCVTARMPRVHRRRGSVLVLVMTLLGILFVTGIAFLASMNFEADLIDAQRQRDQNRMGAESVIDDLSAVLRDGLIAGPGFAFGTQAVGQSITSFADLPGVHNLSAPIEPRQRNDVGQRRFVFDWITDIRPLKDSTTKPDGSMFRQLRNFQDFAKGLQFAGIDMDWPPGVPVFIDGNPVALTIDTDHDLLNDSILPVDADGDGISDTLAFPLSDLGFSDTQIAALSAQLNPPTNREGKVYLGLRVIPHGGMVNLNESHPLLIANVLGINDVNVLKNPPALNLDYGFFRHRPSSECNLATCPKYAAASEEPLLRRRNLLPPKDIPPSLLHGTPVEVATDSPAPGGADMAWMLYPPRGGGEYETVSSNDHRYTPLDPKAFSANCDAPIWAARMEPFVTEFMGTCDPDEYDRRHLVTTVSHDDLLSRNATWPDKDGQERDMLELMRQANHDADGVNCPDVLPFEYADYPQDIANETIPNIEGNTCNCPTEGVCRFDPRKGRLQLSLNWLDQAVNCASETDPAVFLECASIRNRIIYDVFFMLLSNARGPYWDDIDCSIATGTSGACPANEDCKVQGTKELCSDPPTGQRRSTALKSRTAASLTANLIDYMDLECQGGDKNGMECRVDADCGGGTCMDRGIPTRIALRSFDFSRRTCVNDDTGKGAGTPCTTNADCGGNETCRSTAGWEFGSDRLPLPPPPGPPRLYVYGLEKQPYITEVATRAPLVGTIDERAVEIFNPYGIAFPSSAQKDEYVLVEVDPSAGLGSRSETRIKNNLRGEEFTVFVDPQNAFVPIHSSARVVKNGVKLNFLNGWIVYLVHRVRYPGDPQATDIIVDQFTVGDSSMNIGMVGGAVTVPDSDPDGFFTFTLERVVREPGTQWTAPVPRAFEGPEGAGNHSLGTWNGTIDPKIRPVEVQFANTGSFTRLAPVNDPDEDPAIYDPAAPPRGIAFPTTGSMLLAMRHANRSLDDFGQTTDLAFTTWLDRSMTVLNPVTGAMTLQIPEHVQVDNGRMPVFDPPVRVCQGTGAPCTVDADCNLGAVCIAGAAAHHVMPSVGACCIAATNTCQNVSATECNNLFGTFLLGADCANNACTTGTTAPGGIRNLPWGQLVFDYFTALPLSNPGPYENINNTSELDTQPRVDLDGLRVHGRININAAPWKVLAGLPLVPMNNVSSNFRPKIRWGAGLVDPAAFDYLKPTAGELVVNDDTASPIGRSLAQAIVAYRELRQLTDPTGNTSGNFGMDPVNGRDWALGAPAARRGSGFISVGELANVRHPGATTGTTASGDLFSFQRIDLGEVGQANADFVEAVGLLVALGDWVSVRSHVFTVYGTLRGDWDMEEFANPTIENYEDKTQEVTNRALRFQETIDRLPTFLGASEPVRIGQRVVRKFTDVNND